MNLPYFIASRLTSQKATSFSKLITRLAILATALSIAIMIISVAIVQGYKANIQNKLFSFWGHFHIALSNPNPSTVLTPKPIPYDNNLVKEIKAVKGIENIYPFAVKPAIISTKGLIQGIKLKGINADYNLQNSGGISFSGNKIQFKTGDYAHQIILSESIVAKLNKHIGDSIIMYFVDQGQDVPRIRKLQIAGTFHTGVEEVDNNFGLCDINLIRRVSNWDSNSINGYQIQVYNYKQADSLAKFVYKKFVQPPLTFNTIEDIYPGIYSWLGLIDMNTQVIILILSIVAVINMATALLIFIMERTNMIALLKSLGMNNKKLWLVFLHYAVRISVKGIIMGTIIGVVFCLLQQYLHIIKLNEATYYMSFVPIQLIWWQVLLIIVGGLIFCTLILMIPALIVRRINIIKALRFK